MMDEPQWDKAKVATGHLCKAKTNSQKAKDGGGDSGAAHSAPTSAHYPGVAHTPVPPWMEQEPGQGFFRNLISSPNGLSIQNNSLK